MSIDRSMPPSTDKYDVRVTEIAVLPKDEPLFSERTTRIGIVDEAAGAFVTVTQDGGHTAIAKAVAIDPEEWLAMREAIDFMIKKCLVLEQGRNDIFSDISMQKGIQNDG